jgi:hypothetical protein
MRLSRETWIGVGALVLAVAAMAVDHLFGNDPDSDDSFPVDLAAFLISVGVSAFLAAFLFVRVVPRAKARRDESERAAVEATLCSGLAFIPGLGFLWLGFPLVLAGGGIALGLLGRRSQRKRLATAAIVVGVVVVMLGSGAYLFSVIRDL